MEFNRKLCNYCKKSHPLTKEWWQKNGQCKKYKKDWQQGNRVAVNKSKRLYVKNNPERRAASSKKSNQKNWAKTMVKANKAADIDNNRYDPVNYITKQFCEEQMERQKSLCHYCEEIMLYGIGINRTTNREAATIERLDNSIGHNQDNCVLCHTRCQHVNHPLNKPKVEV